MYIIVILWTLVELGIRLKLVVSQCLLYFNKTLSHKMVQFTWHIDPSIH